jgi:hypothetical protein
MADNIMLNRYHGNGLIMWPLCCSLYLAFGHCGKVSKKTGTDLLVTFQLSFYLLMCLWLTLISYSTFISEVRKNWMKWKQSWLAIFITLLCQFMDCIRSNSLLSCVDFQDAAFKSNKGESKSKSKVSTQTMCHCQPYSAFTIWLSI